MNTEKDIGADVRRALPAGLAERLTAVENALGRAVRFLVDDSIRGHALGSANSDGVIKLSPQSAGNITVIGEEIMHLHRRTCGYPAIEPTTSARTLGFDAALLRLGGHFDEVAFFPYLEQLGLNPRGEIVPSIAAETESLTEMLPGLVDRSLDHRQVIELPVAYVRAAMLAPEGAERRAMLTLFDHPSLARFRDSGRTLCAEIDAVKNGTPDVVGEGMRRCLTCLGVIATGATVRMFAHGKPTES